MSKQQSKFRLLILAGMVGASSLIQFFDISLFGAKPNFAAVGVVMAAFFISDFFEGVFLSALAVFFLKFSPGREQELIVFFALAIASMALAKKMPWNIYLSFSILVVIFSLLFYSLTLPAAIISRVFFKEVGYNIVVGTALIFIMTQFRGFKE